MYDDLNTHVFPFLSTELTTKPSITHVHEQEVSGHLQIISGHLYL